MKRRKKEVNNIKKLKNAKKISIPKKNIIIIVAILIITIICGMLLYKNVYLDETKLSINLIGKDNIILKYNEKYTELGAKAKFRNENLSKKIKITGKVNTKKIGNYNIKYEVKKVFLSKIINRTIKVVDNVLPIISLKDSDLVFKVGEEYKEPGYTATDEYDGDLTNKVIVTNNIDNTKAGNYEVVYKVSDSSNNEFEVKRNVTYKPKPKELPNINNNATKIAVLNYHFFYSPGENSGDGNFISTDDFEEQLKYLKNNNYKTLTMEEFRAWMYGEINLPARSVLLTIDDGGKGTSFINGNKLIPLLEKYQEHATLFLISAWGDKQNYASNYLNLESHSFDMHIEKYCSGVTRGAKMLCMTDEEVLNDLKLSINRIGSSTAFAFPFYAYSDHAIELLQQSGFKLAFIGGASKATRNTNKYKIPRYHIYKTTTLEQFINMIA